MRIAWTIAFWIVVASAIAMVFGGLHQARANHRTYVLVCTEALGKDLITRTNAEFRDQLMPRLQVELSNMVPAATHVSRAEYGDEPTPLGDGTACSRLFLENNKGEQLEIRLSQDLSNTSLARLRILDYRKLPSVTVTNR